MTSSSEIFCVLYALYIAGLCGVYATPIESNLEMQAEVEIQMPTPTNAFLGMQQAIEKCRNETNAAESDFETLMRRDLIASRSAKCLRACLMKRFNLMTSNGKFNAAVARRIVYDTAFSDKNKINIAEEIIDICVALEVSEDHCEAAEQYGKCAMNRIRGRGLI